MPDSIGWLTADLHHAQADLEREKNRADTLALELESAKRAIDAEQEIAVQQQQRADALEQENRRLRGALEPFVNLANRFAAKTEGCEGIEDYDRIRVEYGWAEFNSFIRVRDLRAALAPAVAPPSESSQQMTPEQMKTAILQLAKPLDDFMREHGVATFMLGDISKDGPGTFDITGTRIPLPSRIKCVLNSYGSIYVIDGAKAAQPASESAGEHS